LRPPTQESSSAGFIRKFKWNEPLAASATASNATLSNNAMYPCHRPWAQSKGMRIFVAIDQKFASPLICPDNEGIKVSEVVLYLATIKVCCFENAPDAFPNIFLLRSIQC
jgi:hypothetical protein